VKSTTALTVCLSLAAMGAGPAVHAQARGPANRAMLSKDLPVETPIQALDDATRSQKMAEMEAWLGRLVGQFSISAKYSYYSGHYPLYGNATCSRFGRGSGVRCILERTNSAPVMRSPVLQTEGTWAHAVLLFVYFGINADRLEIQSMVVDLEQVTAQSGMLTGDTVTFSDNWKACLKGWTHCWMVTEVSASAVGDLVMKAALDAWFQGSKGPPMILMKSGHTAELEVDLRRKPPLDASAP